MRRLAVFLACLAWVPAAAAQTIYVSNTSTNVTDASIVDALPAFQQAADLDFFPYWNQTATLQFLPAGETAPSDAWSIAVSDDPDVWGAAGYHSVDSTDTPYAKVFTRTRRNWQLVFTHELFELLADPHVNRATFVWPNATFYLLEVCDPVESQRWSYMRPSATGQPVVISDFVTERWFNGVGGQRLDYLGHVHHAHHLLDGGYALVFSHGAWNTGRVRGFPASIFYERH